MTNQPTKTVYSFTPEQAGNISMMLSDLGVTLENVRRALDIFAPDYPIRDGVEVTVNVYDENRDAYADGRILVIFDWGYDFATFPNSNSDGVLISHGDKPGEYYGTMDVDGGKY